MNKKIVIIIIIIVIIKEVKDMGKLQDQQSGSRRNNK